MVIILHTEVLEIRAEDFKTTSEEVAKKERKTYYRVSSLLSSLTDC